MKQESSTTLDNGIQQQKQFIGTPKDVAKDSKNVKNTTAVNSIEEKVGNNNKNNDENNDDNDNPQQIGKKISEVQPMVITNGTEIKTVAVTNGNDQTSIDSSNNSNNNNNNNDKSNNKSNNVNSNSNEELDDKELLSKISETLAEFYGGGKDYDESEEAQKCAKVSNITLTKEEDGEREDIDNNISPEIKIRDFAFPTDDPRHWGQKLLQEGEEEEDNEYVNKRARALYDFVAENSSELSFQEGDILLVQYRQCEGWFMANLGEETGLIPENYVKLLDDDEDDEDEYGNWAEEGNNDE